MKKSIFINPDTQSMYTQNEEGKLQAVYTNIFSLHKDKKGRLYLVADVEEKTSAKNKTYYQIVAPEQPLYVSPHGTLLPPLN